MKLSWQELHFRLTPRKICAVFCAACMAGVWLALTAPRQLTPIRKPSGSPGAVGFSSLATNSLYGRLDFSDASSQPVMLLRDAVSEIVGDAFVVAQQVVPEGDPVFGVLLVVREQRFDQRCRAYSGSMSARNARSSSGGGSRPWISR